MRVRPSYWAPRLSLGFHPATSHRRRGARSEVAALGLSYEPLSLPGGGWPTLPAKANSRSLVLGMRHPFAQFAKGACHNVRPYPSDYRLGAQPFRSVR